MGHIIGIGNGIESNSLLSMYIKFHWESTFIPQKRCILSISFDFWYSGLHYLLCLWDYMYVFIYRYFLFCIFHGDCPLLELRYGICPVGIGSFYGA